MGWSSARCKAAQAHQFSSTDPPLPQQHCGQTNSPQHTLPEVYSYSQAKSLFHTLLAFVLSSVLCSFLYWDNFFQNPITRKAPKALHGRVQHLECCQAELIQKFACMQIGNVMLPNCKIPTIFSQLNTLIQEWLYLHTSVKELKGTSTSPTATIHRGDCLAHLQFQ